MALANDTTLVGTGSVNGANTITLSNFSTGGTNRLVLVYFDSSNDTGQVSSVTATGLTFTLVSKKNKAAGQGYCEIWGAWSASTQTNLVITVNTAGFPQAAARTETWSGTDLTGTVAAAIGANIGQFGSAGSTAPTATITTTRDNSRVIGMVGTDSTQTITAGSNQTKTGSNASAGGFSTVASLIQNADTATSGSSVTINATMGGSVPVGLISIEILAPAAASTPTGWQQRVSQPINRKPILVGY